MSIATEKDLPSSDRYMLIRLTPGKYINDDLSLVSAGVYGATLTTAINSNISKIERNGASLTEVSTLSGNDQYTYDESTGELRIQLASAPDEDSNVLILFFNLFYTGTKHRYFAEDPTSAISASNPERDWIPRITNYPTIEESFKNIINAVFTIKGSRIQLINSDSDFNKYTGLSYSFKNKDIKIWIGINDVTPEELYTGPLEDVNIMNTNTTITFKSAFDKMQDTANFGDDETELVLDRSTYSNLDPDFEGKPIPIVVGAGSGATFDNWENVGGFSTPITSPSPKRFSWKTMNQAINIDFESAGSSGKNEEHILCRIPAGTDLETQTIGTFVRSTTNTWSGGTDIVHYYYFTGHNLKVGQTFKWDDGSGPYYATVTHVGDFTFSSNDYNVMVSREGNVNLSNPIMSAGSEFRALKYPTLMFRAEPPASSTAPGYNCNYLNAESEYTFSTTTTTGGNTLLKITLSSTVAGVLNINDGDGIYWQVHLTGSPTHAETMQELVEGAGLTIDSSSFTQADSDLTANTRFQIPFLGETQTKSYRFYAEKLAASTLGFLSQNPDGTIKYEILAAPSSGNTRDNSLVLNTSASVKYEASDIISKIIATNRHAFVDLDSGASRETATKNKARYLHGINKILYFEHVLEDFSGRIDAHMSIKGSRQALYNYATASEDIDSELGDDQTLESDKITPTGTENVKITSLRRSPGRVQVQATDLGDL